MKKLSNVLLELPLRRFSILPIVWNKIVGKEVARFAHVTYYKDGILYISVPGPVWANELSIHSPKIIEEMSKQVDIPINEIKFRIYPFYIREEKELNLEELTEEEKRYIESIVSNVKYEKIRDSLFKIIGYHILRKRHGIK